MLDFSESRASRLKKGMVKVARVRLNVIGQDGVGKTCLVRLLFHEKFEEQPSTCGLNLSKAVTMMKSHAGTDTEKWRLLTYEEHKKELNKTFKNARTDEANTKGYFIVSLINYLIMMEFFAYGVREREQRVSDRQYLGDRLSSGGSTQISEGCIESITCIL